MHRSNSEVLHPMTEIDPPFKRSTVPPFMSLNAFRAIENDFFDRVVLDGGGNQAGGKAELIIC